MRATASGLLASVAFALGCGGGTMTSTSSDAGPTTPRADAGASRAPDGGSGPVGPSDAGAPRPPGPAPEPGMTVMADHVTQYGITWTFAAPVPVGRFVNGDYYVVGPVTISNIDPRPLWGAEVTERINMGEVEEDAYPGEQARNGSTLNPSVMERAGYDSRIPSGFYEPSEFTHLPIAMSPGDALVSTISRRNDEITRFSGQHVDPLRAAAVLTCVGEVQASDAFRPSYVDTRNSRTYRAGDLRRDLLLSLPRTAAMPASLDEYVRRLERPWLDQAVFGFAAPIENLPHYGQEIVELVGEASLLLLMDYPAAEKERLLVPLMQVGIDFWGLLRAGKSYYAHGGLHSGRKWPVVLAGILFGDERMQAPARHYPDSRLQEDDQTALTPYVYMGRTFERGWTGARAIFVGHTPWILGGSLGNWDQGRGPVDLFPPAEWPRPGEITSSEGYRRANTSSAWVAQALAARMMHVEPTWNHDAFFAYVDRWMTEDDTAHVAAIAATGRPVETEDAFGRFGRQGYVSGVGRRWVIELWQTYRNALPPPADGHTDPPAETSWR